MQSRMNNKSRRSGEQKARVSAATRSVVEMIESRVLMSTTVAAWDFDSLTIATNLSPAPSTGTGTALSVGLQTSSSNTHSPGGVYAYPNPNASGTGDISDILNGTGNNGAGDQSSTGATTTGTTGTNPAWRVRGSNDGWSDNAALVSQGAQFSTSTVGASGIAVTFDLDPSSGSAPSEIAVEYTTDGTTWNVLPASALATGTAANGTTDGISVRSNSTDPNTVNGGYFQVANNADGLFWQNGLTANLSGISGVNNNPNFGIRIVNAATGTSEFEVGGTAYPAAGAGNWRLDNVQIVASGAALTAPTITTNPTNQPVAAGQPVTFTAAASGNPTPTVQWYKGAVGSGTSIPGATSATYTFTTLADGSENGSTYYAVFTNSQGSASTTAATLSDALAAPVITTQPASVSTTAGNTATFTAAASGSPVPTVQWQSAPSGSSTFTNIAGATSANYSVTATTALNGTQYRAVFTNSQGAATTNVATLTATGTTITTWNFDNAAAQTATTNPAPSTGTGSASSVGMTSTGTAGYPTPGATGPDASAVFEAATGDVGSSDAPTTTHPITSVSLTNNVATLTASNSPVPGNFIIVAGLTSPYTAFNGTFTVTAATSTSFSYALTGANVANTAVTAGTVQLTTYIWRVRGTNGWNSNTAIGTQGAQFLASTAGYQSIAAQFDLYATTQGEGKFQVEYTTDGSTWNNVPAADLSTNGDAGIAVLTNSTSSNTVMGGYFDVTGGQNWYDGLGVNLSGIAGANNNPNFGIRIVNAATGADCVNASGAALNNTSGNWRFDEVQISGSQIPAAPSVTTQPTNQTVAAGSPVTFTAAASGFPAPTVQWQSSTNGGATWTPIPGATSPTYTFTPTASQTGTLYEAVFTNNQGSATTNPASLTVTVTPTITQSPVSQNVSVGATVNLTAAATGSPTPTVQWQVSTNGGASFTNIPGATSTTYTFTATESITGDEYHAVFTNSGGSATTTAATITVIGTPISQWIFSSGTPASPNGNTSPGTANAPYPTLNVNPIPTDITTGSGAQVIGFGPINYTGVQQYPEADITQLASGVTPTYKPWVWRVRAGNGSGPTGSPGSPEGWSQYAPQYSQGVEFAVDTTGFSDVTLHFDWNGGGIRDMQPQYTPDGGKTWINVGPVVVEQSDYYGITPGNTPTGVTVNLQGITAANNNPNFGIRLVAAYDPALPLIADGNLYDGPLGTMHGQYAAQATGAVNAQQTITLGDGSNGGVTGGTFTLSFNGATAVAGTPDITWSSDTSNAGLAANAAAIANYLAAIPGIGAANISVVPADQTGYRYTVTFKGALGNAPQNNLVIVGNNLTGPAAAASNVATWVPGAATGGVTRYVDGGGAWSLANFSFNGYSTSGAPSIVTEPAPQTVVGGTTATFSATAYADSPVTSVQWQVSTDGGKTWSNAGPLVTTQTTTGTTTLVGTNSATSTFTVTTSQSLADNGYEYRAVFANAIGSVSSLGGLLSVVAPQAPTVTVNPISQSVQTGNVVDFTAAGTGSPNPTIQWQVSTNGGGTWTNLTDDGVSINGSTTTTLELVSSSSENGYEYRALFTNEVTSTPSTAATLTVLSPETTLTDWDFSAHAQNYDNSPAPTVGAGTAAAIGFDLPYNPSDPATGDGSSAFGSFNADDVTSSPGLANPNFSENTWRIRGGTSTGANGGTPSNGWSNLALPGQQGAQFSVSTVGYSSIYITFDWYSTKSGIRDMQLQYTLDGTHYINLGSPLQGVADDFYGATFASDPITHGAPVPVVMDLTQIPGAANNPNFSIRMTAAYDALLPQITDVNGTHGQYANVALAGPNTAVPYNGSKGNWRFDNIQFHAIPITTVNVTSVAVNGNNPALAGAQRSMVDSIVYTFSQAVTLAATNAFTIGVHAGQTGTVPTLAWSAISPDGSGASTQWAVTFSGAGVTGGSIADGVYDITLNSSAATVEGNPAATVATRPTDTFFRLYGDVTGDGRVNNADYNQFLNTFNLKAGQLGYLAALDATGTGSRINNADYNLFLNNFNRRFTGFTATI